MRPALIIGFQNWTVASTANQELATIMQIGDDCKGWVNAMLNRMRRAPEPVTLREMPRYTASSRHLLANNQQRWRKMTESDE